MKLFRCIPQYVVVAVGAAAALLSAISDDVRVKIVAALLTITALVLQYLLIRPFTVLVRDIDWHEVNGVFIYCITAHEHGRGRTPHTHLYEVSKNGVRQEVEADKVEPRNNGDVFIQVSTRPKSLEVRIS